MSRKVYVFADESGNFDFSRRPGASRYLMLGSVLTEDPAIGDCLVRLRRDLAHAGLGTTSTFHASEDQQAVRDRVFAEIGATRGAWRFDVTILDKPKAQPSIRTSEEQFYKRLWTFHFKKLMHLILPADELLVVAASLKTRKPNTCARKN